MTRASLELAGRLVVVPPVVGCWQDQPRATANTCLSQSPDAPLVGEVAGMDCPGCREGGRPPNTRERGVDPSEARILEDRSFLVRHLLNRVRVLVDRTTPQVLRQPSAAARK